MPWRNMLTLSINECCGWGSEDSRWNPVSTSLQNKDKVLLSMYFITLNSRSLRKASHQSWNPLPLLLLVLPNIYIGSTIKSNNGNGYFKTVTYYCLDYSTSCSWQNNQANILLLQRLLFISRVQLQKMQNNLFVIAQNL